VRIMVVCDEFPWKWATKLEGLQCKTDCKVSDE
jgi:hypothetical protein